MEKGQVLTGRVCWGLKEARRGTRHLQSRLGEWDLRSAWRACWRFFGGWLLGSRLCGDYLSCPCIRITCEP